MNKYFTGIKTLEELKKSYKKLALKLHPDMPKGNEEQFKQMANEYENLFNILKMNNKKTENENVEEFKNIIDVLIKYENINIEMVGTWLWVSGQGTKAIRNVLKKFKFFWNKKRQLWQRKSDAEKKKKIKYRNSKESDETIKNRYGCKVIKESKNNFKPVLN